MRIAPLGSFILMLDPHLEALSWKGLGCVALEKEGHWERALKFQSQATSYPVCFQLSDQDVSSQLLI